MQSKFIVLLLTICSVGLLQAQEANHLSRLHLDKAFYATGEVVQYQVYMPVPFLHRSNTLRISLHDAEGKELSYHFLRSNETGTASGYYAIPFDAATQWYQLVVTAINVRDGKLYELVKAPFPIYNDLAEAPPATDERTGTPTPNASGEGLTLTVNNLQATYAPGSPVTAQIEVSDAAGRPIVGEVSVSVIDQTLLANMPWVGPTVFVGEPLPSPFITPDFLYELGQVQDTLGRPAGEAIMGAYTPLTAGFAYTDSQADGGFLLDLPFYTGTQDIQFLIRYQDPAVARVHRFTTAPVTAAVPYGPALQEYLLLSRQRKKMYQLFRTLETPLQIAAGDAVAAAPPADRSYQMDDYDPFPTVGDFFREISSPLVFRKRKQQWYARIFSDGVQDFFAGDPIFIIDGQVTRDANFIASIPMAQIEQVDLYYDYSKLMQTYFLLGEYGAIVLHTREPLTAFPALDLSNTHTIHGLQPEATVADRTADIPDFRPQVYWATLRTDTNGRAELQFTTTDDVSSFSIHVFAQDAQGATGSLEAVYRTK